MTHDIATIRETLERIAYSHPANSAQGNLNTFREAAALALPNVGRVEAQLADESALVTRWQSRAHYWNERAEQAERERDRAWKFEHKMMERATGAEERLEQAERERDEAQNRLAAEREARKATETLNADEVIAKRTNLEARIASETARADTLERERDERRIEADHCHDDYEDAEDIIRQIAEKRPNRPFDPWAVGLCQAFLDRPNRSRTTVAGVRAEADRLREALRGWQRVSPVHRYECNPWSDSGCTCGLNEVRKMTQEALAVQANAATLSMAVVPSDQYEREKLRADGLREALRDARAFVDSVGRQEYRWENRAMGLLSRIDAAVAGPQAEEQAETCPITRHQHRELQRFADGQPHLVTGTASSGPARNLIRRNMLTLHDPAARDGRYRITEYGRAVLLGENEEQAT